MDLQNLIKLAFTIPFSGLPSHSETNEIQVSNFHSRVQTVKVNTEWQGLGARSATPQRRCGPEAAPNRLILNDQPGRPHHYSQ